MTLCCDVVGNHSFGGHNPEDYDMNVRRGENFKSRFTLYLLNHDLSL